MEIPVNEIVEKKYVAADGNTYTHLNDTINTAKIVLRRINNQQDSQFTLPTPKTLLMIPKTEMYSFFENNKVADYKTSFLASYVKNTNTYTFNNIANLVKHLYETGDRNNSDWNKVVIIPVTTTYNTIGQTKELISVAHDMSLTSTRLVGGPESKYGDIKISVIYSKFK